VFGKLLSYATSGITNLIAKYAVRASVAIPILFAFGIGLAGLTVVLIDAFGYRDAYFLLAGGFVVLGAVATLGVWLKERNEEAENTLATEPTAVATTAVEVAKNIPSAITSGTLDASSSFRGLANIAARNWPLVLAVGIAIIGLGGSFPENRYERRHKSQF
jgi:hypothetical protein